jgi:transcriptional regulator with XRE-family HTH domain
MRFDSPSFGRWLKVQRKARDFTQEDLADQVGCSVATILLSRCGSIPPRKSLTASRTISISW